VVPPRGTGPGADPSPGAAESPYTSVVGALERAELAARELRLAAETEAEGISARAAAAVAELESATPTRIAAALDELRAQHEAAADAEIAAIEAGSERAGTGDAPPPATVRRAAELLVAAVLGEAAREPG
jgi:hypothetical protein